jgi:hypothetical protein
MLRHWRIVAGALGLALVVASALPIVFPSLLSPAKPAAVRKIASLPQPAQIISPSNFPPAIPVGNAQLSKEAPVSPDGWRVRMPEFGIDLPIVQGDGSTVPYFRAAHYPTTAWPGSGGRSFLYAHAQYGPPVMFGPILNEADRSGGGRTGLDVWVDRPGQPSLHYAIRQWYPAWPYTDLTWLQPTNHEELVLMTCTSWTATDPRVIVIAEPVQ